MQELNAARLSVSKVSEKEWNFIVNELIDGYEDDKLPAKSNPSIFGGDDDQNELASGLPNPFVLVKETIESDAPTKDPVGLVSVSIASIYSTSIVLARHTATKVDVQHVWSC